MTHPGAIEGSSAAENAAQLQQWSAQGRIGVTSASQAGSGSFNWLQHDSETTLQLRGPIGTGSLTLTVRDAVLHMMASDGSAYDADAALAELTARLGGELPIRQLPYWLRAVPAPGDYQWLDSATGNPTLQQDGWRIAYGEFATLNSLSGALRLPRTVTATRDALRVRVVITQWHLLN